MTKAKEKATAPNGSIVVLRDKDEVSFFEQKVGEYSEFKSEHPTDMDILTQMIYTQTLNFRYMTFLNDCGDDEIDDIKELNKMVKENTIIINSCADQLGLTKKHRDKQHNSVAEFIEEILKNSEIYEETIDKLADKAISNMKKMKTLLRIREVCDQEERFKMGITSDDDIFVLFKKLITEFEELDKPLQEAQRLWWNE
jgi:hypothetical protein